MSDHFNDPYFRYSNDFRNLIEGVYIEYPSQRSPVKNSKKGERGYYPNDFSGYYPNSSTQIYNFSFPDEEEVLIEITEDPLEFPPSSD